MTRHGCTPLQHLGTDVLVAVCGAPKAAERHAERACAAALAAVEAINALADETGAALALSVGVASGKLVTGALGPARATMGVWGDALLRADALMRAVPVGGGALASEETLEAAADGVWGRKSTTRGQRQRLGFQPLEASARAAGSGEEPAFVLSTR